MAARGTSKARAAQDGPQGTDTGEGLAEHPAVSPDPLETATDGAPEGVKYGEPRMADSDYAARSYADALTPEHAEALRKVGQHPDDLRQ